MAVRDDFTAGEVLAAADLNDTFGAKLDLAGGKVLQVVRATDATNRTTTSTSLTDASLSVTITPQKNTSAVLLVVNVRASFVGTSGGQTFAAIAITDNSNNVISGAENAAFGSSPDQTNIHIVTCIAYSTPATLSATTYKLRFSTGGGANRTVTLQNSINTAQLYAIEVSA
jgi:hypothetical protein